ncbi:MAG: tetratricopeptide repeat protein [Acidobacteriota bacterium]|nr:tetratricopeptide repeat protein [Acidobacteriota bacterium]
MTRFALFWLFFVLSACSAIATDPEFGVVVEAVSQSSAPGKAGVQAGDLLYAWARSPAAEGRFDSVFFWSTFLYQQSSRGDIRLSGERDGLKHLFEVPIGDWTGVEVRPAMSAETLAQYLEGMRLTEAGKVSEGCAVWHALSEDIPELACWLQLQISRAWAETQNWKMADEALDSALQSAHGPRARIAVWDAIGRTREKQNRWDQAGKAYQKQAALWDLTGGKGLGFAAAIGNLGWIALLKGNLTSAEKNLQDALKIREHLAPGSLDVASSLHDLGSLADERSDWTLAITYYKRALAINENLAPGSNRVAAGLNNLGRVALLRGDLATAVTFFKKSLTIKEKLSPHSIDVAKTLTNLGVVSFERGDLSVAAAFFERALVIQESQAPGSLDLATCLNNLGTLAWTRGDLITAMNYYKQALMIRVRVAPGSLNVAASLNNLGNVAEDRGDFDAATAYQKRALVIREDLAPGSLDVFGSLNNLGNLAWKRGELDTALAFHKRALVIIEKVAPGGLGMAKVLNNLGLVTEDLGDWDAAAAYYRQALAIKEKMAPGSLTLSAALGNLGALAQKRGDLKAAVAYFSQALSIREKLAPGTTLEAETHNGLATAYRQMDQPGRAERHFARSIQALENQLGKLGGSQHVKAGFQGRVGGYYREYISFLHSQGNWEAAFNILERARTRVLHQMIAERDLVLAAHAPANLEQNRKRAAYQIEKIQQQLAALDPVKSQPRAEALKNRLFELRREHDDLIEDIRAASPGLANLRAPRPITLADTRQVLDPGTVLLSYCVSGDKTLLFVATKQAGPVVHTIHKSETDLRGLIADLHRDIVDPGSAVAARNLQDLGKQLFNQLIAPARPSPKWIDRNHRHFYVQATDSQYARIN